MMRCLELTSTHAGVSHEAALEEQIDIASKEFRLGVDILRRISKLIVFHRCNFITVDRGCCEPDALITGRRASGDEFVGDFP